MKLLTFTFLTFNRQEFLEANLKRLITEIKKNRLEEKINIFVGDDKSSDKTLKTLKKYSQKYSFIAYYSNKKNLGLPGNTFKIIEKSPTSQYLWLLSDDDFLKKDRLTKIVNILEKEKPEILYLNYQIVNTHLGKKTKFEKVNSIIGPGLKIRESKFLNNQKSFFHFLGNIGFYNIRMYLAQQSLPIIKTPIMKKNLKLLKSADYNLAKEAYPLNLCLYYNFPNGKIFFLKERVVFITVNNRGWNYDVSKANETVKKYFNPLQKMVLKKYSKQMPLKLKIILYISIIYTRLVPIVYQLFSLLRINKFLLKAQFGKEEQ